MNEWKDIHEKTARAVYNRTDPMSDLTNADYLPTGGSLAFGATANIFNEKNSKKGVPMGLGFPSDWQFRVLVAQSETWQPGVPMGFGFSDEKPTDPKKTESEPDTNSSVKMRKVRKSPKRNENHKHEIELILEAAANEKRELLKELEQYKTFLSRTTGLNVPNMKDKEEEQHLQAANVCAAVV